MPNYIENSNPFNEGFPNSETSYINSFEVPFSQFQRVEFKPKKLKYPTEEDFEKVIKQDYGKTKNISTERETSRTEYRRGQRTPEDETFLPF